MSRVIAAQIRDVIHEVVPEAPVIVEQTGGGTATMYVGTPRPSDNPDREGRYWLSIGPGAYDWPRPWLSTFYLGDGATSIGFDDDGESNGAFPDTLAELREAVEALRDEQDRADGAIAAAAHVRQ